MNKFKPCSGKTRSVFFRFEISGDMIEFFRFLTNETKSERIRFLAVGKKFWRIQQN